VIDVHSLIYVEVDGGQKFDDRFDDLGETFVHLRLRHAIDERIGESGAVVPNREPRAQRRQRLARE
jgi:hypothetical protein